MKLQIHFSHHYLPNYEKCGCENQYLLTMTTRFALKQGLIHFDFFRTNAFVLGCYIPVGCLMVCVVVVTVQHTPLSQVLLSWVAINACQVLNDKTIRESYKHIMSCYTEGSNTVQPIGYIHLLRNCISTAANDEHNKKSCPSHH